MFALVDCNNFYASCERVFCPDLTGKPIVVLSNNDGCVIARSSEAKAVGVPMGVPAFKGEPLFKKHGVHVFSANFPLYGDMSNRVMNILSDFSPDIEVYSIDEAFMKLDGFEQLDLQAYGQEMRARVLSWTGLPTSIGIGPTKSLSKVANRIAKKFHDKTGGVYLIKDEESRIKALKWLKIGDVWGIGRRQAKRFQAAGILTAFDFTQLSDGWVKKNMSVTGLRLKRDLSGLPTLDLEDHQIKKNIATTRTFEENYTEFSQVQERVSVFAASCAQKLRKQHSCCNELMVYVQTNKHRDDFKQHKGKIIVTLPYPTNSTIELSKFATGALKQIFKPGFNYKRAGVIAMNLTPSTAIQKVLFDNRDERHIPLMQAIDKLNTRFGTHKIRLAAQDQKRVWKMKQERLSPRYTTQLSDIITIKV